MLVQAARHQRIEGDQAEILAFGVIDAHHLLGNAGLARFRPGGGGHVVDGDSGGACPAHEDGGGQHRR